jgi:branched-chain amino acid transport system permease protein
MAFLGGLGTLTGPLLGALILVPAQQYLTLQFSQNSFNLVIYGVLFLAIMLLLPEGIVPTLGKYWLKRKAARDGPKDGLVVGATLPDSSEQQNGMVKP